MPLTQRMWTIIDAGDWTLERYVPLLGRSITTESLTDALQIDFR